MQTADIVEEALNLVNEMATDHMSRR